VKDIKIMPNKLQLRKFYGQLPDLKLDMINSGIIMDHDNLPDVENRECGHPDNYDDEIANSDPETLSELLDIDVDQCKQMIDSMQRIGATGSGSYPPNCNPKYPGIHSVAYFDDPDSWPSHLKRPLTDEEFQGIINAKVWGPSGDPLGKPFTMAELKSVWGGKQMNEVVNDFVEEMYRRFGVILYPVFTGTNGQHNIHVKYPVIAGSVIGVGWFPGSDPCPGDHVNLHIDKTYTTGFQGQVGLKGHEIGHCVQLNHAFSNQNSHQEPMSYSYRNHLFVGFSTGESVFGIPKSPSVAVLTKLYGGKPVGEPWKGKFGTPNPPPPNPIPIPVPNPKPDPRETLLERIRNFLSNCAKETGVEETKRRIKAKGLLERIQLRNLVRQEVPAGQQKRMYDSVLAEWDLITDEEIAMLCDFLPDKFEI